MSFILDALKKAESERAHGRVPGLHTQAMPPGKPALRQSIRPYLLLSGVALALLCLALWNWLRPGAPAAKSPDTPAPVAAMSLPAPSAAAPVVTTAAPPATQAIAPPQAAATANRKTIDTSSSNTPQVTMKAPALAKVPAKPAVPAEPPREPQAPPLVAAPAALAAPPTNPSPARSELPENVRQALPKLAISGSIYSETAAHRMLIINGQVFHEGEKPAPDLELEQIKPKTAVFNFKGQRYSVGY
ncbi:general secretion pathway protein GspB [Polaromonas sp.]|uniref:general secretion pathway protein GspB n=1 Tax=Polaromonas sp. TaxID=1869339 RepID=UPI001D910E32|nr:general secretion pathway protein GspB [Polaromonas sp.]MBT9477162.1 general secretion pathway protein GspB [Polaromonas sp.]